VDDTTVDIVLSGNATEDYDEDITNATLLVKGAELVETNGDLTIDTGVTFTAIIESANEELSIKDLKVFPNPTANFIQITSGADIAKLEVYDMQGKLLEALNVNSKEYAYNTNNLIKDIYLIKVTDVQGKTNTVKVVKK